jgi:hypothetical protein
MFKSKVRAINVPQYEHGRLTGLLASLWGNEQFERPALDFASFVQGVTFHDWGYGVIDNVPILEAAETTWLEVVRKGVGNRFDDPTTDIVAKLHIRRLLAANLSPERQAYIDEIEGLIARRLPETGHSREQFDWADKITRFCDNIAFDFSFERGVERSYQLYARVDSDVSATVSYQLTGGGDIKVAPWPFSIPSISGIVIGFQRDGYPEELRPEVLPFRLYPI